MLITCSGRNPGFVSVALIKLCASSPAVVTRRERQTELGHNGSGHHQALMPALGCGSSFTAKLSRDTRPQRAEEWSQAKQHRRRQRDGHNKGEHRQFKPTSFNRGKFSGTKRISKGTAQNAKQNPVAPPTTERTSPSVIV
jgi:hypothetical protein